MICSRVQFAQIANSNAGLWECWRNRVTKLSPSWVWLVTSSILRCGTQNKGARLFWALNVTEPCITRHVPCGTAIAFGKRFSNGSNGTFIGFGRRIGSEIREPSFRSCLQHLRYCVIPTRPVIEVNAPRMVGARETRVEGYNRGMSSAVTLSEEYLALTKTRQERSWLPPLVVHQSRFSSASMSVPCSNARKITDCSGTRH
jgi:hypothetical protein